MGGWEGGDGRGHGRFIHFGRRRVGRWRGGVLHMRFPLPMQIFVLRSRRCAESELCLGSPSSQASGLSQASVSSDARFNAPGS